MYMCKLHVNCMWCEHNMLSILNIYVQYQENIQEEMTKIYIMDYKYLIKKNTVPAGLE